MTYFAKLPGTVYGIYLDNDGYFRVGNRPDAPILYMSSDRHKTYSDAIRQLAIMLERSRYDIRHTLIHATEMEENHA